MSESNYIKIFQGNFIIIQRIISELEKENINPIIKDETKSARLAGFGTHLQGELEMFVNKDELNRANSIIKNITSELQD